MELLKCDECNHQRVCIMYKEYILKLQRESVEVYIKNCKEFDEVK